MAITQDRLILLVQISEKLLTYSKDLKTLANSLNPAEINMNGSLVLERSNDLIAKRIIGEQLAAINYLINSINEFSLNPKEEESLFREKVHFELYKKKNEYQREYRKGKLKTAKGNREMERINRDIWQKEQDELDSKPEPIETSLPKRELPSLNTLNQIDHETGQGFFKKA